ncbi:PIN domain-containing protein [Candidatus Woesearchaeota archaeon]|nr:PIN domain-containing protein [Candidatus Woesearchaeota archaeon]
MRFLDSNIFAYAFYKNENTIRCQQLINEGGITDALALVEAFNIIAHEVSQEKAVLSIRGILRSNISITDVTANLIFEALKKAPRSKRLSFLDLVHLVAAVESSCKEIASFDADFDGLEIPRIT